MMTRCHGQPHHSILPKSVAPWKLVEVENMENIKEDGAQKIAQTGEHEVDDEENGFCNAHGLAEGRGIY